MFAELSAAKNVENISGHELLFHNQHTAIHRNYCNIKNHQRKILDIFLKTILYSYLCQQAHIPHCKVFLKKIMPRANFCNMHFHYKLLLVKGSQHKFIKKD